LEDRPVSDEEGWIPAPEHEHEHEAERRTEIQLNQQGRPHHHENEYEERRSVEGERAGSARNGTPTAREQNRRARVEEVPDVADE
jgi:hypothetical protein